MSDIPPLQISASHAGTQWDNLVPSSENINYSPATEWVDNGSYDVNNDDTITIDGITALGMSANSPNALLRHTDTTVPDSIADNIFVAAYVEPVLLSGNDWCSISISATDSGGFAHGGNQFFNLSTGVKGIFSATNTGVSVESGIEAFGDGFFIWSLVNCQGDSTFGITHGFRPLSDEAIDTTIVDGNNTIVYVTGLMSVIGASGRLNYIPTDDVA